MHQTVPRPQDQRLPPALNIITVACFAASLSVRALDPVLPHVAGDFGVSIATAASFSAAYAFTFAAIQPVIGAAADMFGKARLMIACLALLGLANILGALSTSFPLLFATRVPPRPWGGHYPDLPISRYPGGTRAGGPAFPRGPSIKFIMANYGRPWGCVDSAT